MAIIFNVSHSPDMDDGIGIVQQAVDVLLFRERGIDVEVRNVCTLAEIPNVQHESSADGMNEARMRALAAQDAIPGSFGIGFGQFHDKYDGGAQFTLRLADPARYVHDGASIKWGPHKEADLTNAKEKKVSAFVSLHQRLADEATPSTDAVEHSIRDWNLRRTMIDHMILLLRNATVRAYIEGLSKAQAAGRHLVRIGNRLFELPVRRPRGGKGFVGVDLTDNGELISAIAEQLDAKIGKDDVVLVGVEGPASLLMHAIVARRSNQVMATVRRGVRADWLDTLTTAVEYDDPTFGKKVAMSINDEQIEKLRGKKVVIIADKDGRDEADEALLQVLSAVEAEVVMRAYPFDHGTWKPGSVRRLGLLPTY